MIYCHSILELTSKQRKMGAAGDEDAGLSCGGTHAGRRWLLPRPQRHMIHGIDGEFALRREGTAADELGALLGERHFAEFDAICLNAIKKGMRSSGKSKRPRWGDKFRTDGGCLGCHGPWFGQVVSRLK